ncbi:MAG: hypothetical protein HUU37_06270, partial [Bdellovibrionales bacterium]|nr:hypothetical protein [Bdellovibrionales bacterium]
MKWILAALALASSPGVAAVKSQIPLHLKSPVLGVDGRGQNLWVPLGSEITWSPTVASLSHPAQRIYVKSSPVSGKKGMWVTVPTKILLVALQDVMGTEVPASAKSTAAGEGSLLVPVSLGRERGGGLAVTAVRVDRDGKLLADDGSPAATPKDAVLRLDAKGYARARVVGETRFPKDVRADVRKDIRECAEGIDGEIRRWVEKLADVGGPVLAEYYSPYSVFQRNRKFFLALNGGDVGRCLATLRSVEDEIFERSPWKNTNREDRARLVYKTAQEVFQTISEFGREAGKGKASKKLYADILN